MIATAVSTNRTVTISTVVLKVAIFLAVIAAFDMEVVIDLATFTKANINTVIIIFNEFPYIITHSITYDIMYFYTA